MPILCDISAYYLCIMITCNISHTKKFYGCIYFFICYSNLFRKLYIKYCIVIFKCYFEIFFSYFLFNMHDFHRIRYYYRRTKEGGGVNDPIKYRIYVIHCTIRMTNLKYCVLIVYFFLSYLSIKTCFSE